MSNLERALNRTERLFNIILLLQQRPSLTSRDLAEHFGVSRRTIFRDLRSLTDSGIPLTYGERGGYEILDGYQLPPLMLTAREATTLLMGAEFMKLQSDPSLSSDAEQVDMKIRAVLPAPIVQYIERVKQRTVLDPYWLHRPVPGSKAAKGHWYNLSEVIADQRSVVMEYHVMSRDEVMQRRVDPLALVYYTDHWNLIAHDHLRDDIRNFRLDRIISLRVLSSKFQPPSDFDLKSYLEQKGSAADADPITIRFAKDSYGWIRSGIPAMIEAEEEVEGAVDVTFRFENLEYIAQWLLQFGANAQVRSPNELRVLVRDAARSVIDKNAATPD